VEIHIGYYVLLSDLKKYMETRKKKDPDFAESYESGYEEFKIGVLLREVRKKSNLTQEELARRVKTTKSAISKMENYAEDIKCQLLKITCPIFKKR